jgi:nitric oxide reductase NorE protein
MVELESAGREITGRADRLPGIDGFWVFIGADLTLFTALFIGFVHARMADVGAFESARLSLDPDRGGLNTLLLLTSSWCVVQGVHAARNADRSAIRWMYAGLLGGLGFVVVKATEYAASITHGHPERQRDFFAWYYAITGLHLAHVIVGCILLTVFTLRWRKLGPRGGDGVDTAACFWHLVDALWILIFPLIYLVRP